MNDIELKEMLRQEATKLINEYRFQRGDAPIKSLNIVNDEIKALYRSIQLHEATKKELHDLRQKVSNIASAYSKRGFSFSEPHLSGHRVIIGFQKSEDAAALFHSLPILSDLIPKTQIDLLVELVKDFWWNEETTAEECAEDLYAALEARGLEIREKGQ